ncbi:MAG: thiamine pyrophosphate-binding protein [Dehalococcoidia bacterium]
MAGERYGSDVIVDMLRLYGIEYAALNPGASYRGLHDSLVNYGNNTMPQIIQCTHEKIAVQMAHGYGRAKNKPMAAIVHNLVGLLHSTMGIYYAYLDEAPVMVLGASGPFDTTKRRPAIDWTHTAQNQGAQIREYTKWDDQPFNAASVPESFARAYQVCTTPPYGPVYLCYDAGLQEDLADADIPIPNPQRLRPSEPSAMSPSSVERAVQMLLDAEQPVVMAGMAGQNPRFAKALVEFAELFGVGVIDMGTRFNFPATHHLDVTGSDIFERADVILGLGVKDYERALTRLNRTTREREWRTPKNCKFIDVGHRDAKLSAWSQDFGRLMEFDLRVMADPATALQQMISAARDMGINGKYAERIKTRSEQLRGLHNDLRQRFQERAHVDWDSKPMTAPRLSSEVWNAIKDEDWVQAGSGLEGWNRRLWDWSSPDRFSGGGQGTGTQIGMALGSALAHKGTNKLVVDIQPDGDLLFDAASLWIAAYHHIPMLVVMYNNRAYYNDWEHQILIARQRGRNEENAYLGMDLSTPAPNFSQLAQSMGWYGEGPIEDPNQLGPALERAIRTIKTTGQPALVDAIVRTREPSPTGQ